VIFKRIEGDFADIIGEPGMFEGAARISYVDPTGKVWVLWGTEPIDSVGQEVFLLEGGWDGGEAAVDFTEQETVGRYGTGVRGWKVPAFDGELSLWIRGDKRPTSQVWQRWQRAWSGFAPFGQLRVMSEAGVNRYANVQLRSFSKPEVFPRGASGIDHSVSYRCLDGCWYGEVERFTGEVNVAAGGDLPPLLRLRWDGRATSVRFPAGNTVSLSSIGAERIINLDRGYMGQITDADGNVDSQSWSVLRGVIGGVEIAPGEVANFKLGAGLTLEVTPRFLSPWR